jgi:hypothetical protein
MHLLTSPFKSSANNQWLNSKVTSNTLGLGKYGMIMKKWPGTISGLLLMEQTDYL